jgi:hypothetical protein
VTLISLCSRGRAASSDIGREFRHFAWFGEPCKEHSYGKVKGKGVIFLDLNFPVFATGVHIFRASNDVGPLFVGPVSTRIL